MSNAEKQWLDAISELGCIVCTLLAWPNTPAEPHHLLSGGRRIGHLHTIPLCPPHHRTGQGNAIARHPTKARFEAAYGSEAELLARTQRLVAKGQRVAA